MAKDAAQAAKITVTVAPNIKAIMVIGATSQKVIAFPVVVDVLARTSVTIVRAEYP